MPDTNAKPKDFPCNTCTRSNVCREYALCQNCRKGDPILSLDDKKKAPSLKAFGQRVDEILPITPSYVAVDSAGIRFFSTEPKFVRDRRNETESRWTSDSFEDLVGVMRYDFLEGLFDVEHYLTNDGKYNFSKMIAVL